MWSWFQKLQGCASFASDLKWELEALFCRASGMGVEKIGGGCNLLHLKLLERVV